MSSDDTTCVYCQGDAFTGAPCPELYKRTGAKGCCLTAAERLVHKRRSDRAKRQINEDLKHSPRATRRRSTPSIWDKQKGDRA